jgi:hypothetical protein
MFATAMVAQVAPTVGVSLGRSRLNGNSPLYCLADIGKPARDSNSLALQFSGGAEAAKPGAVTVAASGDQGLAEE